MHIRIANCHLSLSDFGISSNSGNIHVGCAIFAAKDIEQHSVLAHAQIYSNATQDAPTAYTHPSDSRRV